MTDDDDIKAVLRKKNGRGRRYTMFDIVCWYVCHYHMFSDPIERAERWMQRNEQEMVSTWTDP